MSKFDLPLVVFIIFMLLLIGFIIGARVAYHDKGIDTVHEMQIQIVEHGFGEWYAEDGSQKFRFLEVDKD